jgi:hypothetical protein
MPSMHMIYIPFLSFMTRDCVFETSADPDLDGEKLAGKEAVSKAFKPSKRFWTPTGLMDDTSS